MKTYKNLFREYIGDENILVSIRTSMRGNKAKHTKRRLKWIYEHKDIWIPKLRRIASDFHNAHHTPKVIYDGITRKQRTIIVPTPVELIVQHMMVNILKPIFLKGIYEHTYAAIPTRGAHLGKKYLDKWLRNSSGNVYCLKMDIKQFFNSIDTNVLKAMLAEVISDDKFLKQLYAVIDVYDNGLPLGYYTSQWYANWYLRKFDRYIKQELMAKHYMRYMDDIVILSESKEELTEMRVKIESYLKDNLRLEVKKNSKLFKVGCADNDCIDFMGFRFYLNRTTLRKSIMLKASRKASKLAKKGNATIYDARQMMAYLGWINATDTYDMYLSRIKPSISFGSLKDIISKHDRRKE